MNKSILALGATALLAVTLVGCTPADHKSSPANTGAAAAADPSFAATPTPEPKVGNLAFGDAMTWTDGVSISVSQPVPFTPGQYAAGATQATSILFTITLTNGSDANLEPMVYNRVSSGGVEASAIFDSGNPVGEIGGTPNTVVLPGQTVTWLEAYSVADPAVLTFQTNPSFKYEDAIFTNIDAS